MLTFSKLDLVEKLIPEIQQLTISTDAKEGFLEERGKETAIEMLRMVTLPAAYINLRINFSTALMAQQLEIQIAERKSV